MAGDNRRVAAQSAAHAQGLSDNLLRQGFVLETQASDHWVLRKKRRRGDHVVTITIQQPSMLQQPGSSPPPPPAPQRPGPPTQWGPPGTR